MLQNEYFLAKIGADTAENEQHFAEIQNWTLPGRRTRRARRAGAPRLEPAPPRVGGVGAGVRGTWERSDPKSRLPIPNYFLPELAKLISLFYSILFLEVLENSLTSGNYLEFSASLR